MDIRGNKTLKVIFVYGIPIAVFQTIVFFFISISGIGFNGLVWFLISSTIAYFCFQFLGDVSSIWRRTMKTGVFLILVNVLSAILMSVIFLILFSDFDPKAFGQFN